MRLTSPTVKVIGDATLADRVLSGQLTLGSAALRAVASGAVDLAEGRYRDLRLGVDLLRPPALFTNMTGRNVRMLWTLDGPYATARYSYRLTSPSLKFDDTGFVDVRAEGSGRLSPWPMRVPLRLAARAITGVGDVAGAILANARLDGILTITPKFVRGEGLQLRSAKLNAKMGLLIDLVTGRFQVVLSGGHDTLLHRWAGDRRRPVGTDRRARPRRQRLPRRGYRQGVGPAPGQQLFCRTHRRPSAHRNAAGARARRHRPVQRDAVLFAEAKANGRGPPQPRWHVSHRRAGPAGDLRTAADGARRPHRAPAGSALPRTSERDVSACAT